MTHTHSVLMNEHMLSQIKGAEEFYNKFDNDAIDRFVKTLTFVMASDFKVLLRK